MDQLITQIPTTFTGWIISFFVLVSGMIYLFSRIRQNDMSLLREANEDLRNSIKDKGVEISQMHAQIKILNDKVFVLEKQNKTFEELVITALKQFFFENPTIASDLKRNVLK